MYWSGRPMLTMLITYIDRWSILTIFIICIDQADICSPWWSYVLIRPTYAHHVNNIYWPGWSMLTTRVYVCVEQADPCSPWWPYLCIDGLRKTSGPQKWYIYSYMNKGVPITLARDSPTRSIPQLQQLNLPTLLPLPRPNHSSFPAPSPDPSPEPQKVWRTLLHSLYVLSVISANLKSWKMKFLVLDTYYKNIRIKQLKGTVARDFRPPLFSIKRTYLGPWYRS